MVQLAKVKDELAAAKQLYENAVTNEEKAKAESATDAVCRSSDVLESEIRKLVDSWNGWKPADPEDQEYFLRMFSALRLLDLQPPQKLPRTM